MDNILYTFKVYNRRIKATFIVVSLSIFLCFSILRVIGYMLGRPDSTVIDTLFVGLPLGVFIFLWIYGKYRMFGFEWQLCNQGLRILRNGQEIRFIPWKDITDIEDDYKIIDGRDSKKFTITLPPTVRKSMIEKIYELKRQL